MARGATPSTKRSFSTGCYRVTDRLSSEGQPEGGAAFVELTRMEKTTIVSVNGAKPNFAAARKPGLRYLHLDIDYDGLPVARSRVNLLGWKRPRQLPLPSRRSAALFSLRSSHPSRAWPLRRRVRRSVDVTAIFKVSACCFRWPRSSPCWSARFFVP